MDIDPIQLQEEYRNFSRTPAYVDLMSYIDQEFNAALDKAVDETEPQKAVALLQNAQAYKTIKAYVLRMSTPEP